MRNRFPLLWDILEAIVVVLALMVATAGVMYACGFVLYIFVRWLITV
jgi:hypothetical protein